MHKFFFVIFYGILSVLLIPFIRIYIIKRTYQGLEDKKRIGERFGFASISKPSKINGNINRDVVWFHAASVGETLSLRSILSKWMELHPNDFILLTTTTRTAAVIVEKQFKDIAHHQYVPFDILPWVKRFIHYWKPSKVFITESEIWPNILSQIKRRKIPLFLLNARISDRSYLRFLKFKKITKFLFSHFDICLAQNADTADRLNRLGCKNVRVIGNLKWGVAPLPVDENLKTIILKTKQNRPVFLAASTHFNEETQIFQAYSDLLITHPDLILFIAPRHPERANSVEREAMDKGFHAVTLNELKKQTVLPRQKDSQILVIDQIGLLGTFYENCDIVFMGGSLVPKGGQNPIEPAMFKKPILFGPHMYNFKNVSSILSAAGAVVVQDSKELEKKIDNLLENKELCKKIGDKLFQVIQEQKKNSLEFINNI